MVTNETLSEGLENGIQEINSRLDIQWVKKLMVYPLKHNNYFKIGPNVLSFFEKLEGLVY